MAFSYLSEDNLFKAFKDAQIYMRPLFEPLAEFERIARNQPHPGIDKAYPKTTDGTTASIVQKTPRRIIQQLPTGKVVSDGDSGDWLDIFAGWVYTNRILPNANSQFGLLQKAWAVTGKALTYGAQPTYTPFVNKGDYFGPDLTLPYIKDVFMEPGKLSDRDCNYIFMRSWFQTADIDAIIAKEDGLAEKAKGRKEKYQSGWDIEALKEIRDFKSQKDDLATTPSEKDKNDRKGGVEIIHAFQKGIGAKFYSFHAPTKKILRTKVNKDPRGEMPISYMYADTDMSNPLGRGYVELVGALQNLMDSEMQMYQYNRALMLNPPLKKRGNWNKNQAKFQPNAIIDLGSDPNADLEPLTIDTSALQNFPNNYGLMKSQLLNLLASPDASISSTIGNPGFSKTDAGVKQQQGNVSVDDNFMRKQFETWYGFWSETAINMYFAERSGIEDIKLDVETANEIRTLAPEMVNEQGMIRVNWDAETPKLSFKVDASTSEQKADAEQVAELKEILADSQANPYLSYYLGNDGYELHMGEVYRQMFQRLGLTEIDKIITKLPIDPATGKPQGAGGQTPTFDKPRITMNFSDMPPAAQVEALKNAGIEIDPKAIMQPNAEQAASQAPAPQADPINDHPLVKLMAALKIDFSQLPEDSQHEFLQMIGLPSQMQTPTAQTLSNQTSDSAVKVAQLQHQQEQAQVQNQLNAQNQQYEQTQGDTTGDQQTGSEQGAQDTQADQPQQGITADDQAFIAELQKMGYSNDQIGQALALLHHGYTPDQIVQVLHGGE